MTELFPQSEDPRVVATYLLRSRDLPKAADAIAIGQSIGNPYLRSPRENESLWKKHGAQILSLDPTGAQEGRLRVAYPLRNFTRGSLTHLLTIVMGGQLDIDLIESCVLEDLLLPEGFLQDFAGPKLGLAGVREKVGAKTRPLVGGIAKPKTGLSADQLADVFAEMADGGLDFLKEDEILGDVECAPFEERVEKITRRLEPYQVIYCPCISTSLDRLETQLQFLSRIGANGYHLNFWAGLDTFRYAARRAPGLFSFYQKSGDRVMTTGRYCVDFSAWCSLIRLAGADFTHVGMLGGYLNEDRETLGKRLSALRGPALPFRAVVPSFSCGAAPQSVPLLADAFGRDIMVTAGGYLHAHAEGPGAAAAEFRRAAERCE